MSLFDPELSLELLLIARFKNRNGLLGADYFPFDLFKLLYNDVKEYARYFEGLRDDSIRLKNCPFEVRNDKECCKVAFAQDGDSFEYASEEIRNDKECCKVAFSQHGESLKWASKEIRNDKECCKVAFADSGWSLRLASDEIKNDKECCKVAFFRHGGSFEYASEEIRSDKECLKVAVKNAPNVITFVPWEARMILLGLYK